MKITSSRYPSHGGDIPELSLERLRFDGPAVAQGKAGLSALSIKIARSRHNGNLSRSGQQRMRAIAELVAEDR